MTVLDLLARIFNRDNLHSKDVAKERLRLVLVHDRSSVSPEFLNQLKEDMIELISRYLEIDVNSLQVNLENEDNTVALVANIPVKGLRRVAN